MQGQQLLFTSLFATQAPTVKRKPAIIQTESTDARDRCLVYRYYYHIEIQRTRYDDVLEYLEKEFFISSCVIIKRLGIQYDFLKEVVEQKPRLPKLKKLYPHLVWSPNPQRGT
ncbi:hypothetical protein ACVWYG_002575 [Pedobacter sp. UYEF25]